jgi:membrane protease YdiL (CAAX protease family)
MEISTKPVIKPMGIFASLFYFAVPSAIFYFFIYYVMQQLHATGVNDFVNFYLSMVIPLVILLIASLVSYKLEGNRFDWPSFSARFRLRKMEKKDWIYTLILLVTIVLIQGALSFTSKWLIQFHFFAPPAFLLPAVDPRLAHNLISDTFMGYTLKGQWWIFFVYLSALVFNIIGEEFWWRGYILPRQDLALKNWTWVTHGILWALFHVFWKWNLIILLPVCLSLSYVVSKRKNTWIGIIVHMIFNSIPLIGLLIGIIG